MRKSLAVVLGGILLLCLLVPSVASAEEQGDPSGTYLGTVTGSSGKTFEAWAQYGRPRLGWVIVTVQVADKTSIPILVSPKWTSASSFTVSKYLWLPKIVDGGGSATWTQTGDTWAVVGKGTGSVFEGPEGSATGQLVRISTDFIKPPLSADPISDTSKDASAAAGTDVKSPADPVGGALAAAGAMEQSPDVSDGGKAEAGLSTSVAMLAGILLCFFLGASMSGAEFLDVWNAPEGSES